MAPDSLEMHADRDRISQVVSNLASNARHHGKAGHPIIVAVELAGGRLRIRVSNVGEPIDPAQASRMFGAFKQRSIRNDRNPTGLGIGLHIAREIALGHGGDIHYEYVSPHVVFVVELPLERGPD